MPTDIENLTAPELGALFAGRELSERAQAVRVAYEVGRLFAPDDRSIDDIDAFYAEEEREQEAKAERDSKGWTSIGDVDAAALIKRLGSGVWPPK